MDKITVIHSQPKSKSDFKSLNLSKLVICFLAENDLPTNLRELLSNKTIYLNDSEIYNARERSKSIWNKKIISKMPYKKNLLMTNSGSSRSEISTVIQAFFVWSAIEEYLDNVPSIEIITENKDLLNLAYFHNKKFLKVSLALFKSTFYSQITNIKRLFNDLFLFFILKLKKIVFPSQKKPYVAFSLIKHWTIDGDWRYGDDFCKNFNGIYAVSCMRAGGLQNHNFFMWNKLLKNCLRSKNTVIIESMIRWPQFLKSFFSSLSTQISLFIQVLGFIFFSRKNFSYFDLLLLFEENKHLSEMFSNELIYIGSSNFFKNTAPNKTICYHFEFPAGRAFISASKNASVSKVISMQHGIISRGKWCYELVGMMARNKHLKHYTPHLYLLEGVFSWWVLNQFIEDSKIRLVGAPRQDSFHSSMLSLAIENKTISHEIDTSSNTVLLMDLHTTDKNLIEHIKTILKEMNELKQIYIRPHPRDTYAIQKVEKVKKIFTNLSFESLNNSFQSDIKKFNSIIFWGESTGALLDCLGYGINIKVLRVKGMLMLDPIIDIEMNLEDINNFIVEKHLLDVSPVSIDNPNEIFKLLFKNSLKTSSVQVLDCLYN